jgi:hypothetical protein
LNAAVQKFGKDWAAVEQVISAITGTGGSKVWILPGKRLDGY